jgi:hypothetical protein
MVIAKILSHLQRTAQEQYPVELPLGARAPPGRNYRLGARCCCLTRGRWARPRCGRNWLDAMDMQDEGFMLIATACGRILPDPATLEMQVPGGRMGRPAGRPCITA